MSKVSLPRDLVNIIKKFSVLDDWTIEYDDDWTIEYDIDGDYKGQCVVNTDQKHAVIYAWPKGKKCPKDYFLHEVIHIVFSATDGCYEREEIAIRDMCKYIVKLQKNCNQLKRKVDDAREWFNTGIVKQTANWK